MELEKNDELYNADLKPKGPGNPIEQPDNEIDLPPEFCQYRDEGCELADSCLNCPFSSCIYDEPGGKQRLLKGRRAKEIARLYASEGKTTKELAGMFGVCERTVQRALKKVKCHSEKTERLKNPGEG